MHRRLTKLEAAFAPAQLREIATAAAEAAGLDPEDVFREAKAILTRCAGLSLPEIAAQEGIDLADLEAAMQESA
jgi:hypothetical protein